MIIDESFSIYVPNAFTPNGDNYNNLFLPVILGSQKYEMWIYDRWGMQLWHSTDPGKGWDGRVEGKPEIVQQDVYVWLIRVTDILNKKHRYVGSVTIVK